MERTIPVENREELTRLFGTYDRNLKEIKKATGVDVIVRNGEIRVRGTRVAVDRAVQAFTRMKEMAEPTPGDVQSLFQSVREGPRGERTMPGTVFRSGVEVGAKS
ncbi:MAG TPA: hypothetical protein VEN81_16255, partial [Planctomycetota bacterium]|nr:hypothetical protein [Planctomycetota bacterium]